MSLKEFISCTKSSRLLTKLEKYSVQVNCARDEHLIPIYAEWKDDIWCGEYRFGDHPDLHPYFYECFYFPELDKKMDTYVRVDEDGQYYTLFGWDIVPIYREMPLPDISSLTIE